MATPEYSYLVVENAPDVCEGIQRRMQAFADWHPLNFCVGVKEAIETITTKKPALIFLDWSLNGGSAFEILQHIQNIAGYNPYIIFNTGFQKDNPEIPQEIINNYQVDKYLVKPIWENLRLHLPEYVKEASDKIIQQQTNKIVWVEDDNGHKIRLNLSLIECICQHPTDARSRILYLYGAHKSLNMPLQWKKLYGLLDDHAIAYFITKNRAHLVVKNYIEKFEKPFIRLKGITAFKIDVVKENIKAFEEWLEK